MRPQRRLLVTGCWLALAVTVVTAQPGWDAVSIKRSTNDDGRRMMPPPQAGRFVAGNITVRQLLQRAYGDYVFGGPGWINTDGYDVNGKASTAVDATAWRALLRTLLAERFHLIVHPDRRELPVYSLSPPRTDRLGPHFRPSQLQCSDTRSSPAECGFTVRPGTVIAHGVTLTQLTRVLTPFAQRPIIDRTLLTGSFDVELTWTPEQGAPSDAQGDAPDLFSAVREQLGLALEPSRGTVDIFVIDRIERPSQD